MALRPESAERAPSPRKFVIADQNAVSAEGHFQTYTNALACAAQSLGCDVTVLWNKRFPISGFPAGYRMEAVFSCTEAEAAARRRIDYGEGHFGFELERALGSLALRAQDHVVIHTCHFVELVEALDYLALLPPARDLPTFHIIVRYDPDVYRHRMNLPMRRLDAILRTPHLREKLRLHSDTRQLATEFSALFGAPVGVCPIPVDLPRLLPAAEKAAARAPGGPLTATYLGTARSEKGYRDILGAIAFLRQDYIATDRLHFVLQCSDRSIAGEAGLAEHQRQLEDFIDKHGLSDKIRLIKHLVEQEEYCALVAQSDIVLLAYSPESYRYRSSSVLIEAMTTGKVVVTREGSWMASRVGPENAVCYAEPAGLGPALAQAVTRFDELEKGAKARQAEEIVSGDPATLARYFLENAVPTHDPDGAPALLLIADGDEIASGGLRASVFLQRLASLSQAAVRLHVALESLRARDDFDARRRIADALRPHALESLVVFPSGGETLHLHETPAAIYLMEGMDARIVERLGLDDAETPIVSEAASQARSFPLRAPLLDELAGPVDGFELVASCDPLRRDLRIDNRSSAAVEGRHDRLRALESVDILLHATDSGATRRFLEEVYAPFLAARGVTVLAIGDAEAGPDVGDFLFVGALTRREPLYAAAKIVVTTAGPDESLAIFEALARGKPTLLAGSTTPDLAAEGFTPYDEPHRLATAIVELLDSSQRRLHEAERSRRTARKLAGQADQVAAQLSALLGVGVPQACEQAAAGDVDLAEWSVAVRAANRLVRSVLANEPLDGLDELFAVPDANALVARVARALVDDGGAPLLRVDGGLLKRTRERRIEGGAAEIAKVGAIALAAAAGRASRGSAVVVNARFQRENVPEGAEPRARRQDGPELVSIALPAEAALRSIGVRQDIPLTADARALGRRVFANWVFERGGLLVRKAAPTGAANRLAERVYWRLQSFLAGWSPGATANQLFDADWYVAAYPEAASAGIEPFRHYARRGAGRGYRPNPFFDAQWYQRRYGIDAASAWQHYLLYGHDPQFDPGPFFSASRYLQENADVAEGWSWSPLLHYCLLGRREGRDCYPAEPLRPHQSLALPVVIGEGGDAIVEFVLDQAGETAAPLDLHIGDRRLEVTMRAEDGETIVSSILPREAAAAGLVLLQVSLATGASPFGIRKLRTGWTPVA